MHEITSNAHSPWQLICTCASARCGTEQSIRKKIKQYSSNNKQCLFLLVWVFFPKPTYTGCCIEVLDIWSLNLEWMIKARDNGFRREKRNTHTHTHTQSTALHYHMLPTRIMQMLSVCKGITDTHKTETNSGSRALEK